MALAANMRTVLRNRPSLKQAGPVRPGAGQQVDPGLLSAKDTGSRPRDGGWLLCPPWQSCSGLGSGGRSSSAPIMAVDRASPLLYALCLVGSALAVVAGCRTSPMAKQCKTLASTVNSTLDKVEALYTADAPEKADWDAIAAAYESLSKQLKAMKFEDPRLAAATTEYQTTLALTVQTTRRLASAAKQGRKNDLRKNLHELAARADGHKNLSHRIDRLCEVR